MWQRDQDKDNSKEPQHWNLLCLSPILHRNTEACRHNRKSREIQQEIRKDSKISSCISIMAAGNTCGFFIYAFCLHILFSVNHCVIVNYKKFSFLLAKSIRYFFLGENTWSIRLKITKKNSERHLSFPLMSHSRLYWWGSFQTWLSLIVFCVLRIKVCLCPSLQGKTT